jgi:DNA-binding HxlR family transcriptional regulator
MARTLDTIGDWWSLLIIRDAMVGVRRFSDFQEHLGLAGNILSARLKKLVACGIMKQVAAENGSAYRDYVLTKKGETLLPVVIALRQWGEKNLFERGEPRLEVVDARHHKPLAKIQVHDVMGHAINTRDLKLVTTQ